MCFLFLVIGLPLLCNGALGESLTVGENRVCFALSHGRIYWEWAYFQGGGGRQEAHKSEAKNTSLQGALDKLTALRFRDQAQDLVSEKSNSPRGSICQYLVCKLPLKTITQFAWQALECTNWEKCLAFRRVDSALKHVGVGLGI